MNIFLTKLVSRKPVVLLTDANKKKPMHANQKYLQTDPNAGIITIYTYCSMTKACRNKSVMRTTSQPIFRRLCTSVLGWTNLDERTNVWTWMKDAPKMFYKRYKLNVTLDLKVWGASLGKSSCHGLKVLSLDDEGIGSCWVAIVASSEWLETAVGRAVTGPLVSYLCCVSARSHYVLMRTGNDRGDINCCFPKHNIRNTRLELWTVQSSDTHIICCGQKPTRGFTTSVQQKRSGTRKHRQNKKKTER